MNLPNKITIIRIALIPLIIAFYLITSIPCGKLIATILFVVAAGTDFLDGHIARKYNLVTDTGKFLDPIADKILLMAGLLLLFQAPTFIPVEYLILASIIIIARDNLINSLRQVGVAKGVVISAAKSGKIKSALLDISVSVIMFYNAIIQLSWFDTVIQNAIWWLGLVLFAFAMFMVIYSNIEYFIINKKVFSNKEN